MSICVLFAFMMSLYLCGFVFILPIILFPHFLVLSLSPMSSSLLVLCFVYVFCLSCLIPLSFLSLSLFFFSLSPRFFLSRDCATRSRLGIVLARHRLISPLCRLVSEKCGGWRNCHTYFNNHHGISITIMILPYRPGPEPPAATKTHQLPHTHHSIPSAVTPYLFTFQYFFSINDTATDNSSINSA